MITRQKGQTGSFPNVFFLLLGIDLLPRTVTPINFQKQTLLLDFSSHHEHLWSSVFKSNTIKNMHSIALSSFSGMSQKNLNWQRILLKCSRSYWLNHFQLQLKGTGKEAELPFWLIIPFSTRRCLVGNLLLLNMLLFSWFPHVELYS